MFTLEQMAIISFCAEECKRQESGEISVFRMVNAWDYAMNSSNIFLMPTYDHVRTLGALVDPRNHNGFRKVPVYFEGGAYAGMKASIIERAITNLQMAIDVLSPEEYYQEFETIHPFVDGNGRVGVILFNWIRGSLHNPEPAPEFVRPK